MESHYFRDHYGDVLYFYSSDLDKMGVWLCYLKEIGKPILTGIDLRSALETKLYDKITSEAAKEILQKYAKK